ncbi:tyrosine-type recombinase/integrase [Lysinibacillus sphaericus]|uniref:tyrosine-type recombinase/integrase n=1 Tax=Lysinibacillus sphaericus TaxID=1421 RepID=UPI001E629397|nr:tyrosine-type recombinase/integrase [Lysinibacillus sphaericus]
MELVKSTKEKEVYSYLNNKGEKLWMFRHKYYDGLTGKRKEKKKSGFKTEKAAIKALFEVKAQTLRGETKYIENDNLTVGQWLDIWYETNHKKWKPATVIQRESFIRLQLKPLIGSVKLKKLDKVIYQKYFLNKLEGKYKPSTIRSFHVIMRTAINAAIEEEILIRNKLTGAALPTKREGISEDNYLSPDQLSLFLNFVEENEDITHSTLFHLLAYTGMRKGEALGLQWKNIDFKNRSIEIIRHRGTHGVGSTKTKNSERTIKVEK